MIRVAPSAEPEGFDERCRKRGVAWCSEHPGARRPRDYWSEFRDELKKAFGDRCGYTAIFSIHGTTDHFHCYRHAPHLAHEWTNYRYAAPWVNSSKQDAAPGTFMDPFEVEHGWFEIILPSLELVVVKECVPPHLLALAEQTLSMLPIGRHPQVIKDRRYYYEKYTRGKTTLGTLNLDAPQIAAAIAKRLLADAHRSGRLTLFVAAGLNLGADLQAMFPTCRAILQDLANHPMPEPDGVSLFIGDDVAESAALEHALGAGAHAIQTTAPRSFVMLRNPSDADIERYQRDYHVVVIRYSRLVEVWAFLGRLARNGPDPQGV